MPSAKKRRAMEHEKHKKQLRLWGGVAGIVVLIALIAVVLSQSSDGSGDTGGETQPVTVEGEALPTMPDSGTDPAIGLPGPTLRGQSFDGTPVTIDPGATGNPTAVWVVAHWCSHCQAEVPRVASLNGQGRLPSGIDYYAVSSGTQATSPNYPPSAWLQREGWPFPVLADDANGDAGRAYGLYSYPLLILLDKDGNVVYRHAGELGEDGIAEVLQQLAA